MYVAKIVETTQKSINEQENKMWHIHATKHYSATRRNEVLTNAATWMNSEDVMLSETGQDMEGKMLCDFTPTKYLEQANS